MKIKQSLLFTTHKHIIAISILSVLLIVFLSSNVVAAESDKILNLATGSKVGVYYPIGKGIADAANKANIKINVLNSEGSIENLNWLEQGKVDLCLAQSDTVYNAYNGLGKFPDKLSNLRVITSLYTEAVHIIIRNSLHIKKVEDMRSKRISLGPVGSGTESNALAILEAAGMTKNEFIEQNLNFEDSIKAIKEGNVDIVFITSGVASEVVNKMVQNGDAYLFELKADILERLIENYPFFIIINIPPGTYPHQDEEISSIGVPALLVGRSTLDDEIAYNLVKAIFSNTQTIAKYHSQGGSIKLETSSRGVAIPISSGAIKYYEEKGLVKSNISTAITSYFPVGILLILLIAAALLHKKIIIFLKNHKIGRILVSLVLVWFINAIILYIAEHRFNDNYSSFLMSLWSGLVNLINFGSKEPFTNIGRTTSTVMTILWVAGITWLTAQMAASFVNYELKGKKKMKDHYIIINWNSKAAGIIKQLKSPDLEERGITIIAESSELDYLKEMNEYKSIRILRGNPAHEMILKNADIHDAHSVIILADNDKEMDISDTRTILTLLTILKVCKHAQVSIIAEILEPKNVSLIKGIADKENKNVEIVCTKDLGAQLLTQCVVNPGISKIYEDLLTFDEGKNADNSAEMYKWQIPAKLKKYSFKQLLEYALNAPKNNIIPVAISRKDGFIINPKDDDERSQLSDCDYYFAIASTQKDLKDFNDYVEKQLDI